MPAPLISRDEVVARITEVFKAKGFEGASLAGLSERTGLGKASLYHYFPDGKKAMAEAALDAFGDSMAHAVVAPLMTSQPPATRLKAMLAGMNTVYNGGDDLCLFALLSVGETRDLFHSAIVKKVGALAEALARTLQDSGLSAKDARKQTEKVIVEIEGALIVSRVLNDPGVFQRALSRIREDLAQITKS